jgi:phage tail sheath protein FI
MGFLVSPGVDVKEIDLTNVIPAVSTSIGATVGNFAWGPMDEVVTVGSEKDLVAAFGKPNDTTFQYFYNAATFLNYGNNLKVVRSVAASESAKNSTDSTGTAQLIKNKADFVASTTTDEADGLFIGKYAGEAGNDLKVTVISPTNTGGTNTAAIFTKFFSNTPDANELHIVVEDAGGSFVDGATAAAPKVLEIFENVSLIATAKGETGGSNYYIDVLRDRSNFIYAGHPIATDDSSYTGSADTQYVLAGGVAGVASQTEAITDFSEFFGDAESNDVNFFIAGAVSSANANTAISAAQTRKDVIGIVTPPTTSDVDQTNTQTAVNNVKSWADGINSSSYGVLGGANIYVYDKYNDTNRWVSSAGSIAGLMAYTDDVADAWFSPAGFNRGQVRNVIKLSYNATGAQRDTLYKARVNPIVSFPGQGTVLFGDKTALSKPSAFDRINVRRLFITIEKAIATAAKFQLFEFNDEFTRAMFRNMTEPFLREVKGRRGISDFAVICDETNNTGNVIDTNQFVADIYVKPARSINYITLNFIATRTGIEFSEVIGE